MYREDFYKILMYLAMVSNFGFSHTCIFRFKNRGKEKLGCIADAVRKHFVDCDGKTVAPMDFSMKVYEYLTVKNGLDAELLVHLLNMDYSDVVFTCEDRDGDLFIEAKGPWYKVTFFEIPVLSYVQEEWSIHNGWVGDNSIMKEGIARLEEKVKKYNACMIPNFSIIEMGTRRAFSQTWFKYMVSYLAWNLNKFNGTSNIGMAMDLGVPCRGTMAHEYLQAGQVLAPSIHETNSFMLKAWLKAHKGKYAIALSDCLTTDVFFREFDKDLAEAFSATRQDSGSPFAYGDKVANHYRKFSINTKAKNVCFSDSLNSDKALDLVGFFADTFKSVDLGIGTDFSHDVGVVPLKIVMKMVEFDEKPVIKISDDAGKAMGVNDEYAAYVRKELGIA